MARFRFQLMKGSPQLPVGDHASNEPHHIRYEASDPERKNPKPTVFRAGDIIESNLALDEMFVGKFRRLHNDPTVIHEDIDVEPAEPVPEKSTLPPQTENAVEEVPEVSPPEETKDEGDKREDVTDEFPTAAKNGFKVFRQGHEYSVADEDSPAKAINKSPLKRKDVAAFVREKSGA